MAQPKSCSAAPPAGRHVARSPLLLALLRSPRFPSPVAPEQPPASPSSLLERQAARPPASLQRSASQTPERVSSVDMDAALLKPAAGHQQAAPRRAAVAAAIQLLSTPAAILSLRVVQLLLAAAVLAVTATMIDELVPGTAIRRATLTTGWAAAVQAAWTFPLAVLDAAAVLGNGKRRRRHRVATYLVVAGDLFVGMATLGAVCASLGLANYAATEEGAEWPRSAKYIAVVAASFGGFAALYATTAVGVHHAARGRWD